MDKIRNLSQRYTLLFVIGVYCAYMLLRTVAAAVTVLLPPSAMTSFVTELLDFILPVALLVLCGYGFALRTKGFGQGLKAGIVPFLFYLFLLLMTIANAALSPETKWPEMSVLLVGILSMIGVGIREETIFRGLVGNTLVLKYGKNGKGLFLAVLLSSLVFGGVHVVNFFAGVKFSGMIAQVLQAASLGALFTAIYLRGGNLWVLVLIHAIIDSSGLFAATFMVSEVSEVDLMSGLSFRTLFVAMPVQIALAFFLLRKSKRAAVFARLDSLREEFHI